MTNITEQTLASIVTEHHQTVPVLEKYNLDFCCKGKRTLAEACTEKGLSIEEILKELEASSTKEKKKQYAVYRNECGATDRLHPYPSSFLFEAVHAHHCRSLNQ